MLSTFAISLVPYADCRNFCSLRCWRSNTLSCRSALRIAAGIPEMVTGSKSYVLWRRPGSSRLPVKYTGTRIGMIVGDTEGDTVGASVGSDVVGDVDGEVEGEVDGLADGEIDGLVDGETEGEMDGLVD